jgi:hypothetical protein
MSARTAIARPPETSIWAGVGAPGEEEARADHGGTVDQQGQHRGRVDAAKPDHQRRNDEDDGDTE